MRFQEVSGGSTLIKYMRFQEVSGVSTSRSA